MSLGAGGGFPISNGGGLEALLEAAKYVEQQEILSSKNNLEILKGLSNPRRSDECLVASNKAISFIIEESPVEKEVFSSLRAVSNGNHCPSPSPSLIAPPQPQQQQHLQLPPAQAATATLVVGAASLAPPPTSRLGLATREVHNKLEKNRRAHLKECFELLKKQVPISPEEKKTSNLSILHSAIKCIQALRRKDREYEHELERLAREKIAAQQRLAALKKDLAAQWDHIDFNALLPNSLDSEPRRPSGGPERGNERMGQSDIEEEHEDLSVNTAHVKGTGTLYSSASSLSSASPLQTTSSLSASDLVPHHLQMVPTIGAGHSTATSLLVSSGPTIQLLPPTALRMIPEGITIPNGVLSHAGVPVTLSTKHATTDSRLVQPAGIAPGGIAAAHMVNHSIVVSQPNGQVLLPLTSPTIGGKVMAGPLLKPVGHMPLMNTQQFLVKPAMVVVSTPSNATK